MRGKLGLCSGEGGGIDAVTEVGCGDNATSDFPVTSSVAMLGGLLKSRNGD